MTIDKTDVCITYGCNIFLNSWADGKKNPNFLFPIPLVTCTCYSVARIRHIETSMSKYGLHRSNQDRTMLLGNGGQTSAEPNCILATHRQSSTSHFLRRISLNTNVAIEMEENSVHDAQIWSLTWFFIFSHLRSMSHLSLVIIKHQHFRIKLVFALLDKFKYIIFVCEAIAKQVIKWKTCDTYIVYDRIND